MHVTTPSISVPILAGITGVALALASCASKDVYSEEPLVGTLKSGEVVLVDDGSCPEGQIKEVTAGNRSLLIERTRRCIDK